MLIDCHAHILPAGAVQRFPDPASPAFVTAEPRALQRMLDEHDRVGVTHAVVSDSFYMDSAPALRLAIETFGVAGVLFGNDYPPVWVPLDGPLTILDALGLPDVDLEAIRWRNAAQFFGLPLPAAA